MCPRPGTLLPRVSTVCAMYITAEGTTLVARARSDRSLHPACAVPSFLLESSVKQLQTHESNCRRGGGGGNGGGGGGEGAGLFGGGGGSGGGYTTDVRPPLRIIGGGGGGGGGGIVYSSLITMVDAPGGGEDVDVDAEDE